MQALDFLDWQTRLEPALHAALHRSLDMLRGMPIARLDIGVFAWHGAIEISFLLSADLIDHLCKADDVAAWPRYNFVNYHEGEWPEAEAAFKQMRMAWEKDVRLSEQFYRAVAEVTNYQSVASVIQEFTKADLFTLTLFDPDRSDSTNFCA